MINLSCSVSITNFVNARLKNNKLNPENTTQGTNMPLNRTARTHFLFRSIEPNAWAKQNQICKGGWASQFCSAMRKMDPPLKSTCEKKWNIENFNDHGQSKGRVFENVPLDKNVLLKRLKSGCLRQTRTNNHSSSQKNLDEKLPKYGVLKTARK